MTHRAIWMLFAATMIVGCAQADPPRSSGWNTKATLNERIANERVKGFTSDDAARYHLGLQHIINKHQSVGSFTIAQVVDQERSREKARSDAVKHAREAADAARVRREEEARNHDYCKDANKAEIAAAQADGRREYQLAVAGLAANERCADEIDRLVNEGYLLSFKAMAEHAIGSGDWRTDFNQANALLVRCQTTPGLYGTKTGAQCETQEGYNIHAKTTWEMDSYR